MKHILLFSTLIVLLASCGKEDDLQPKSNFLDDLLGIYVGQSKEDTFKEEITRDANGNVIDITTYRVDTLYVDTLNFIREPTADSSFSFMAAGERIGPLKWNNDGVYQTTKTNQKTELDIEILKDEMDQSLEIWITETPDTQITTQDDRTKKFRFSGIKQ